MSSRVLSIQSHVVRGYVGNKAAVFPLQLLGHHVDFIDSVAFTSMYIHEGQRFQGEDAKILLDTLPMAQGLPPPGSHPGPLNRAIDLSIPVDYGYLLTGYVGSRSFLEQIVQFVVRQRGLGAKMLWFCDPVMGDNGNPYVAEEVMAMYKERCIPLADIITPNQYELQWLCDANPIESLEDAARCCLLLHERGPRQIIVTSIQLPHSDQLVLLASEKGLNGKQKFTAIEFPKLDIYLGGTGDLMAAMILDGMDRLGGDLYQSCLRALQVLQGVIRHTVRDVNSYDIDVIGAAAIIHDPSRETKNFKLIPLRENFPN